MPASHLAIWYSQNLSFLAFNLGVFNAGSDVLFVLVGQQEGHLECKNSTAEIPKGYLLGSDLAYRDWLWRSILLESKPKLAIFLQHWSNIGQMPPLAPHKNHTRSTHNTGYQRQNQLHLTQQICNSGGSRICQRGERTMVSASLNEGLWGGAPSGGGQGAEAESFLYIFIQMSGQKLRI